MPAGESSARPALAARLRRGLASISQPLFIMALAAAGGILIADSAAVPWPWWLAATILALFWLVRSHSLPALATASAVAFGFAQLATDTDPLRDRLAAETTPGGALPAEFKGLVLDAPEPDATGGWIFTLQPDSLIVTGRGPWPSTAARLYVRLRDVPQPPAYGDRIACTGLLRRPAQPRNPGEFDFASFLRRQGFSAEAEISGLHDRIDTLSSGHGSPIMASAIRARDWIAAAVTMDINDDPPRAATVRAMVLGTREKTPQDIEDAFIASGTMHVFAVSGLHVGMFTVIVWNVLRLLGLRRGFVVLVTLPLIFFYVYVTGLRASAWRAALMASIFLAGPLWNREGSLFSSLGAAAVLLLAADPAYLFQPGFTLSFGVLLAMAAFHQPIFAALRPLHEPDPFLPAELYTPRQEAWFWLRRKIAESLSLSMASTLGSAPLMIGYFRLITPVGIAANLVLVLLSLCILVVACMAMAAVLCHLPYLAASLNHTNWLLASLSISSAKFFAAIPGGNLRVDPARLWRGEVCDITILDLDHGGSAIHIDTPSGRHWLIDSGANRHYNRTVHPHLSRSPVNSLDGLILTHNDGDHSGAAAAVQRDFSPLRTLGGPNGEPLTAGSSISLDPHTSLHVLFPPPRWLAGPQDDACAVLLLECFGTRILLTGDSGFITEKHLLSSPSPNLSAHIIVKGWHASDFSALPEFLNAVSPHSIIFNQTHFPAGEKAPPAWLALLARKHIHPIDQSTTGAVTIRIRRDHSSISGFLNHSPQNVIPPPP